MALGTADSQYFYDTTCGPSPSLTWLQALYMDAYRGRASPSPPSSRLPTARELTMPAVNDVCQRSAAAVPNVHCVTVLNMFGVLWKYTRVRSMQMGTVCRCVRM